MFIFPSRHELLQDILVWINYKRGGKKARLKKNSLTKEKLPFWLQSTLQSTASPDQTWGFQSLFCVFKPSKLCTLGPPTLHLLLQNKPYFMDSRIHFFPDLTSL